jgi:predicted acyltransferase
VRIIAGTWSLVLGIILLSHGYQWAWGLFAVSAVIFSAAYVLAQAKSGSRHGGPS